MAAKSSVFFRSSAESSRCCNIAASSNGRAEMAASIISTPPWAWFQCVGSGSRGERGCGSSSGLRAIARPVKSGPFRCEDAPSCSGECECAPALCCVNGESGGRAGELPPGELPPGGAGVNKETPGVNKEPPARRHAVRT